MMEWSTYFQNPTFMEMSRKTILSEEYRPIILQYCRLKKNQEILDVGCGTGSFTRYLGEGEIPLSLTGIDTEARFIQEAIRIVQERTIEDRISFLEADACDLPFSENRFDHVVSHTFFTSVTNPKGALSEMIRVTKPGGTISSITAMSFVNETWHKGYYPPECTWYPELQKMESKVWKMYQTIDPYSNYTKGKPTSEMPHFFWENGLKEISIFPIGKAFSLSNAAMALSEKQAYIEGMDQAEREKLTQFMKLPAAWDLIAPEDAESYFLLLSKKREYLLSTLGENEIWDWSGGANVLVTGVVSKA